MNTYQLREHGLTPGSISKVHQIMKSRRLDFYYEDFAMEIKNVVDGSNYTRTRKAKTFEVEDLKIATLKWVEEMEESNSITARNAVTKLTKLYDELTSLEERLACC